MLGSQPKNLAAVGLTSILVALFILDLNSNGRRVSLVTKKSSSFDSTYYMIPNQKVIYKAK
jgi:hypothetical protein